MVFTGNNTAGARERSSDFVYTSNTALLDGYTEAARVRHPRGEASVEKERCRR
jgi:hypothetical protein